MEIRWTHLKFPRVLAGSEDFFAGLQHPDSPVQIRSAPLVRYPEILDFQAFQGVFIFRKSCTKLYSYIMPIFEPFENPATLVHADQYNVLSYLTLSDRATAEYQSALPLHYKAWMRP